MARAGTQRWRNPTSEGDDVQRSIELLDKVLSEYDENEAEGDGGDGGAGGGICSGNGNEPSLGITANDDESPSLGHQSEDDGYMSMNGRKPKMALVALRPVPDCPEPQDNNSSEGFVSEFPPPPEEAERLISTLLPMVSPSNSNKRISQSSSSSSTGATSSRQRNGKQHWIAAMGDDKLDGHVATTQTTLPKTRHQRPYGWDNNGSVIERASGNDGGVVGGGSSPPSKFASLPYDGKVSFNWIPPRTNPGAAVEKHREVRRRSSEEVLSNSLNNHRHNYHQHHHHHNNHHHNNYQRRFNNHNRAHNNQYQHHTAPRNNYKKSDELDADYDDDAIVVGGTTATTTATTTTTTTNRNNRCNSVGGSEQRRQEEREESNEEVKDRASVLRKQRQNEIVKSSSVEDRLLMNRQRSDSCENRRRNNSDSSEGRLSRYSESERSSMPRSSSVSVERFSVRANCDSSDFSRANSTSNERFHSDFSIAVASVSSNDHASVPTSDPFSVRNLDFAFSLPSRAESVVGDEERLSNRNSTADDLCNSVDQERYSDLFSTRNSDFSTRNSNDFRTQSEEEEHFSDDSLEELLPPPPPSIIGKRHSIAWEVSLEDDPLYAPGSTKVVGRRRRKSSDVSSVGSASKMRDFDDWPDPPLSATEDDLVSPYSDSSTNDIDQIRPQDLTKNGTYVIRRGRKKERKLLPKSSSKTKSKSFDARTDESRLPDAKRYSSTFDNIKSLLKEGRLEGLDEPPPDFTAPLPPELVRVISMPVMNNDSMNRCQLEMTVEEEESGPASSDLDLSDKDRSSDYYEDGVCCLGVGLAGKKISVKKKKKKRKKEDSTVLSSSSFDKEIEEYEEEGEHKGEGEGDEEEGDAIASDHPPPTSSSSLSMSKSMDAKIPVNLLIEDQIVKKALNENRRQLEKVSDAIKEIENVRNSESYEKRRRNNNSSTTMLLPSSSSSSSINNVVSSSGGAAVPAGGCSATKNAIKIINFKRNNIIDDDIDDTNERKQQHQVFIAVDQSPSSAVDSSSSAAVVLPSSSSSSSCSLLVQSAGGLCPGIGGSSKNKRTTTTTTTMPGIRTSKNNTSTDNNKSTDNLTTINNYSESEYERRKQSTTNHSEEVYPNGAGRRIRQNNGKDQKEIENFIDAILEDSKNPEFKVSVEVLEFPPLPPSPVEEEADEESSDVGIGGTVPSTGNHGKTLGNNPSNVLSTVVVGLMPNTTSNANPNNVNVDGSNNNLDNSNNNVVVNNKCKSHGNKTVDYRPRVPPHRSTLDHSKDVGASATGGQHLLSTPLNTRSMDAGFSRGRRGAAAPNSLAAGGSGSRRAVPTERRTLPTDLPGPSRRRPFAKWHSPSSSAADQNSQSTSGTTGVSGMQTSCSLPETPVFARGTDIPRTPQHAGNNTGQQTRRQPGWYAPTTATTGGYRRNNLGLEQAIIGTELLRLAGGPNRGWYPTRKGNQPRPASIEHLERLNNVYEGRLPGSGEQQRKPLTLPTNITPNKYFGQSKHAAGGGAGGGGSASSTREALRRVTSLLIKKGGNSNKDCPKVAKDINLSSDNYPGGESSGGGGGGGGVVGGVSDAPKKKGFFKSFWKRSRHYSLENQ